MWVSYLWGPHVNERIPCSNRREDSCRRLILGDDAACGVGALAIIRGLESGEEAERGGGKWHDEREDTVGVKMSESCLQLLQGD